MDSYEIDADQFASTLNGILNDVLVRTNKKVPKAIRKGAKLCKLEVTNNAERLPLNNMGGKTMSRYKTGFNYKMKSVGDSHVAYVGNKNTPGLVHLLEKGHAKVGGGRVRAYPHVAPAADVAFKATYEYVSEAVGESL